MIAHVAPTGTFSRAMVRIADALAEFAPSGVEFTDDERAADIRVLYAIGHDYIDLIDSIVSSGKRCAVVQCCMDSMNVINHDDWRRAWSLSDVVWSYYDMADVVGGNFYHAPLGVDRSFVSRGMRSVDGDRRGVLTSGYVHGPRAEAIEEVAVAAATLGIPLHHLGPAEVEGMSWPVGLDLHVHHDISDAQLAELYSSVEWVSGLRRIEGFELPVIEGAACGARPIVFDRPDMSWFDGIASFVSESSSEELVSSLVSTMSSPVKFDRAAIVERVSFRFDWKTIVEEFWRRVNEADRQGN